MTKWFNVGKVVNTHGIMGEVRVISTTDFADERFEVGAIVYLEHPNFKENLPLTIASHRQHKNFELLTFENYPNMNDVLVFKGGILRITEDQLTELAEEEFYYHEIVGCDVATEEGEELGKVKEIIATGANDVWVIQRTNGGKDLLIPYIEQVVKAVDLDKKKITIQLIDGLE